jgi:hypothetical protein
VAEGYGVHDDFDLGPKSEERFRGWETENNERYR